VLGTVAEGLDIDCTAAPLDETTVGVRFRVERAQMETPLATLQTEHGAICTPVVAKFDVESKIVLPDGALFAYPLPDTLGQGNVLLLQVERVRPER
jgi:hypothetical protein